MPQRELYLNKPEQWMKQYDRPAYEIWIKILRPELGRSILKTNYARKLLRRWSGKARGNVPNPVTDKERAVGKVLHRIHRRVTSSDGFTGTLITMSFLHRLALDRQERLMLQRERARL